MQTQLATYRDIVDHALDFLGGDTGKDTERYARRAVQMAVNDFWSKRQWSCFTKRGRIITQAPYATGTITYLYTGGSVNREVTLAGGTWPSWAAEGTIIIDNIAYPVSARASGTVVQLTTATALTSDIATATSYNLVRDSFPLPVDFGSVGEVNNATQLGVMTYLQPTDFLVQQQHSGVNVGTPAFFTIGGDGRRYGTLAMSFCPVPDAAHTIDFIYRRQSRALSSHGASPVVAYTDGTVTITSASTAVVGTGTLWTSSMVGTVIRFAAASNGKVPTGQSGASPFYIQRTVTAVTDGQNLTIDQVPGANLTTVPYSISDPIDLEAGAMMTYFLREVENQLRIVKRIEPMRNEEMKYQEALRSALEADSRHHESRSSLSGGGTYQRLADMPRGADIL